MGFLKASGRIHFGDALAESILDDAFSFSFSSWWLFG